MAWYWWAAATFAALVGLALLVAALTRRSEPGRRFWALGGRGKLAFGRALLRDPGTPRSARVLLVVLIGYLLLPFDLIPDFIPLLGQADDVLAIAIVLGLLLSYLPRDRLDMALAEGERVSRRD